jgi:hypothetical protein
MIFEKKNYLTQNVCFDFLYNFHQNHFSFEEEMSDVRSKINIALHVKSQLFLSDFNQT